MVDKVGDKSSTQIQRWAPQLFTKVGFFSTATNPPEISYKKLVITTASKVNHQIHSTMTTTSFIYIYF
jgi:hypothetical protein